MGTAELPQDISIAGFDNIQISECATPKLTTIQQHRELIGKEAARILLNNIDQPDNLITDNIRIPTSLIIRKSTKRIKS